MLTTITSGVRISVESHYEAALSSPLMDNFIFSYNITIENQNDFPIQLLRRHWFIFDSCGQRREVEGPGVIGYQPVIQPGGFYKYNSACDLNSFRGTMHGSYSMTRADDRSLFRVDIPRFIMEVPYCLN